MQQFSDPYEKVYHFFIPFGEMVGHHVCCPEGTLYRHEFLTLFEASDLISGLGPALKLEPSLLGIAVMDHREELSKNPAIDSSYSDVEWEVVRSYLNTTKEGRSLLEG